MFSDLCLARLHGSAKGAAGKFREDEDAQAKQLQKAEAWLEEAGSVAISRSSVRIICGGGAQECYGSSLFGLCLPQDVLHNRLDSKEESKVTKRELKLYNL